MSTETTTFTIGAAAACVDGPCGMVSRVVVDPVARAVTHLVVDPKRGHGTGRLVPVDLVDAATGEVRLRCTTAEFDELEAAEETQFLQESDGFAGYQPGQALSWPFYAIGGMSAAGMGIGRMGLDVPGSRVQELTYETIPLGEVDVHRGDHVQASDGDIGRVQGLVIDPRNHHVTHVLLEEGHMWGRKEVAIPIASVTRVDDGIRLDITRQEVQNLPSVDIARSHE